MRTKCFKTTACFFLCLFLEGLRNLYADLLFQTTAVAKSEGLDPVKYAYSKTPTIDLLLTVPRRQFDVVPQCYMLLCPCV